MNNENTTSAGNAAQNVTVAVSGKENGIDFEKITFMNDFMFCSALEDEKICKEFIERVLGIEIAELEVTEKQKNFQVRLGVHGIRLDVYVKDVDGNVYDIEAQVTASPQLPKRSRFYHSETDAYALQAGQKYTELKKSIVIFACAFDPFGYDRSRYTFRMRCDEEPECLLGDEVTTIFLNTQGNREGLDENLVKLLDYMSGKETTDDYTQEIDSRIERLRKDRDWRTSYMTYEMKLDEEREAGRKEGRAEGMQEGMRRGIEEGRAEGMQKGMQEGMQKGREEGKVEAILALVRDHLLSPSDGAKSLGMTESELVSRMARV